MTNAQSTHTEQSIATTTTKEEITMTNTNTEAVAVPMTVNELAAHLIGQGVDPVSAVATAQATVAAQAVPTQEAPVEKAPIEEAPAKEVKVANKPWYKRASEKLKVSDKDLLMGYLLLEKAQAKTAEEKEEIQGFILKIQSKESFYKDKVEPALAKSKGWAIDSSGKISDTLYLTGEYVNKGASGLTKAIGKTTQMVGKGIIVAGEAIEGAAPAVGKIVEAPFKLTGDTVEVLAGKKDMPKPKKAAKTVEA